MRSRYTNL